MNQMKKDTPNGTCRAANGVVFLIALVFSLVLQGALPFVMMPTMGQAVWTTGFAQSFLNDSVFSIWAHNFGAPQPAYISFGLAGAWLTAVFMRLGLHAADAYSAMIAVWMSVSFVSAYYLARNFSVTPLLSTMAATCWLTMPVIWAHAGYCMLSTGMALLPFYFLYSIKIFEERSGWTSGIKRDEAAWLFLYPFICIISVFMDGYSFMMFAVGSTVLGLWSFLSNGGQNRKHLMLVSFPVHIVSLGVAYILYALYIGKFGFDTAPLDFFRGWGVDLTFILIPTRGMHWLPDLTGWSISRSPKFLFGDESVWITSFSIPVIIGAVWAVLISSQRKKLVIGLAMISLFGFYMSLGPSIKFNSTKPSGEKLGALMPERYAIAPNGSGFLSKNLPGFRNMRASYRWGALGVFGAWALLVSSMSAENRRRTVFGSVALMGIVMLLNLPNPSFKWKNYTSNRSMFLRLESDLVEDMRMFLHPGERVAFLPWRNDFLANYVASKLNVVSFNIGGDKNLEDARKHWPAIMRDFPIARVDDGFAGRVYLMLARKEADCIVFPYIDMLWAAHSWPYPAKFKEQFMPVIARLAGSGLVEITDRDFFAVVRLKSIPSEGVSYPITMKDGNLSLLRVLGDGWNDVKKGCVQSGGQAGLVLPVPEDCSSAACLATLDFFVFGASAEKPVEVSFTYGTADGVKEKKIIATNNAKSSVDIPLPRTGKSQNVGVNVRQTVSPGSSGLSDDAGAPGIALSSVRLFPCDANDNEAEFLTCFPPDCVQCRGRDWIYSKVGVQTCEGIQTDGRRGYLMYGPYVPVDAGEYLLEMKGHVKAHGDKVVVDVVGGKKGTCVYGRFVGLGDTAGRDGKRILLEKRVVLNASVDDLEIRVWVDEGAEISVDGYSFKRAKN
jgi:hypothetical protein